MSKWFGKDCEYQACQWEGNEITGGPDYQEILSSLIFCGHKGNADEYEGSCTAKLCPLKAILKLHLSPPYSTDGRRPYIVAKCGMERYITAGMLDKSGGCFDWPSISIEEAKEIRDFIIRACNSFKDLFNLAKNIARGVDVDVDSVIRLVDEIDAT